MDQDKELVVINYIYIFIIMSVIGWLYEMSLFFVYGTVAHMYNRGLLLGPYLPIYGFGGLLITRLIVPIKEKLEGGNYNKLLIGLLVLLATMALTSLVELLASYLIEIFNLPKLWDYSKYNYNFQGRISLNHSIRFGLGGLVFIYLIKPLLEKVLGKTRTREKGIFGILMVLLIALDFIYSLAFRY